MASTAIDSKDNIGSGPEEIPDRIEDPDGALPSKLEENDQEQPQREGTTKSKSVLKQGHLRVKEDGQMIYKRTPSQAIMAATQLGIGYSVGRLGGKAERDILMADFGFTEKVWFPSSGSKETPSHKFDDFRFKSYAPVAFRYFRELFGILPSDFLISLSNEAIKEISNPGASGSLFFVSNDDNFIVKTVQHKECTFLQQLLPGYYMNLHQNPRTLLPKFFGIYCYQSGSSNIRLTVMNNLLPSQWKCHMKFDLKGSTYKRMASKQERAKSSPVLKDLDFLTMYPDGILLDAETYDAVIKTISRDVRWLESFKIMDYSFLLGIHKLDDSKPQEIISDANKRELSKEDSNAQESRKNIGAALEAIQINKDSSDDAVPVGGIPAKTSKGERLILFIGIIDILQSYRLAKKMEHGWKSLLTDGNTVSVHKPSYYAKRFLSFIKDNVFTKVSVQRGPSKRRSLKQHTQSIDKGDEEVNVRLGRLSKTSQSEDNESPDKPRTRVVTIVEPNEMQNRTSSQYQGGSKPIALADIDISSVQPTIDNHDESVFIDTKLEDTTINQTTDLESDYTVMESSSTVVTQSKINVGQTITLKIADENIDEVEKSPVSDESFENINENEANKIHVEVTNTAHDADKEDGVSTSIPESPTTQDSPL